MIAHISSDLMMASTAKATAAAAGREYKSYGSLAKLQTAAEEHSIEMLIVDLQTPGLDLKQLAEIIENHFSGDDKQVIGYAQHVAVDLLEQAQGCGFNVVMTRGQINSGLGRLFASLN